MKKNLILVVLSSIILLGCGQNAEKLLKKYITYSEVKPDENKAGVQLEMPTSVELSIKYSCPLLNTNEENMQTLSERWFVANVDNPNVKLPVKIGLTSIDTIVNDTIQQVVYAHIINLDSIKVRFLLIGFEGIGSTESKEAETPPLFFLVEKDKAGLKNLTLVPRLAGKLFVSDYTPTFFSEQEYSGEIQFEKSKNVTLKLTLSRDMKKVTKLILSAEELQLTLPNFDKQRRKLSKAEEDKFIYSENSNLIMDLTGKGDANGNPIIRSVQLKGGFKATSPIEIVNEKITLDAIPMICDLTVTNACIYGTVKVEGWGCGTKAMYVVFRNTTTPQEIPKDILNK